MPGFQMVRPVHLKGIEFGKRANLHILVDQGEGRPLVLILVAREFHSRRLREMCSCSALSPDCTGPRLMPARSPSLGG